ncbi:hypothetical protein, partial [Mesorhizobium sp.]|uniref:hypothetical protein n=1 Tax=Mesorhizobium sp. TaxID=1871066 RepID=UPI0025D1C422
GFQGLRASLRSLLRPGMTTSRRYQLISKGRLHLACPFGFHGFDHRVDFHQSSTLQNFHVPEMAP